MYQLFVGNVLLKIQKGEYRHFHKQIGAENIGDATTENDQFANRKLAQFPGSTLLLKEVQDSTETYKCGGFYISDDGGGE